MKSNIIILAAMMAMSCACTNEVEELSTKQEDSSLKIATYIANSEGTRSSDGFVSKTQFKTNDEIGLFLYKGTWGTSYVGVSAQNNKSTFKGSSWEQATPYYLNADKAHVWRIIHIIKV